MSPDSRSRSAELSMKLLADYRALEELREARALTQRQLAATLGKNQSVIARMERRTDMYISTLAGFIGAVGGKLEIRAIFKDSSVVISHFGGDSEVASEPRGLRHENDSVKPRQDSVHYPRR